MNRKKAAPVKDDNEPQVTKVIKQVSIMQADSIAGLEQIINEFLPKINYNDITEPAIELYFFAGKYYAKAEFDVKIKE